MAQRGSKGANESDITSPDVGQKLCFDDETLKGKVTATKTITKIFTSAFNMSKADIFFLFSYDPRIKPNTSLFGSLCLEKLMSPYATALCIKCLASNIKK